MDRRVLAIECATEACSVALFENSGDGDYAVGSLIAATGATVGRGHAEQLIPLIATLPDRGRAETILVSLGPGSFTGLRIGLAAARALGIAWQAQVLGYPTLDLVAAGARRAGAGAVTVCMTGGHGEWFVQNFSQHGVPDGPAASLNPNDAVAQIRHGSIHGSAALALAERLGPATSATHALPDARDLVVLPSAVLTLNLSLLYGRGPDARLPA